MAEAHAEDRDLAPAQDVRAHAEVVPAFRGRPGPGETTIASKSQRDSAPQETVSFWITIGSSPETVASSW